MENQEQTNKKKNVIREFKLSSLSVDNRTTVLILTFIIVLFGYGAYKNIPKESFPEVVIPTIYVGTPYAGNSPIDIENLVTRPIEKELKSINGVKDITSTSVQDYSTIVVEFNPEEDISKALQDVKDAVDKAKSELPTDLDQDPNVMDIDLTEMPIMYVNISGNYSIDELKNFAEYLEDEMEKLSEISKAEIRGAREREIRIDADIYKMEAVNVSFNDISNAVSAENVTLSGGNILNDKYRYSLRVDGEFANVRQIEDVIVKDENQKIVYLGDIATVTDSYKERTSYSRSSQKPVVTVDVVKRSGENLLITARKIKDLIQDAQTTRFPEDLEITITNDQSKFTKSMVDNLENSIITGVLLVVLVLMFFMGLRNSLFVGVAIPLSMFIAFILLTAIGYSANMMVLFGMILALGMLVDNGIVVVENIYRLLQEGYTPIQAAKEGVGEVAWPIITSTATTLAAFVPLAFWTGIMGEFMKYLPITLILVLSSSLFVALVINPVLTSMYMKLDDGTVNKKRTFRIMAVLAVLGTICYVIGWIGLGSIFMFFAIGAPFNIFILSPGIRWFQQSFLPWLEDLYSKTINFALHGYKPYLFFGGTVVLLFVSVSVYFIRQPKVSLFPDNEPNYINIFIEKPIGVDIDNTNEFTKIVEEKVLNTLKPYENIVESVITNVGEGASDPNQMAGQQATPNKSLITVSFVEYEFRKGLSTLSAMEDVRNATSGYPGVQITVDKEQNGPPVGKPINIEITGDDFDRLIAISERVKTMIEESNIQGIEELKSDLETGKPEILVNIDRDKARRFGLSTQQIAFELRTALFGQEVSKYKEQEDEYPIQLRLMDKYRYDIDALMDKKVTFRDNQGTLKTVPISSVANIEYSSTYGSVRRKDLTRMISLYSNVIEGYNATEIVEDLKVLLSDFDMPEGYDYKFTGEQEEQAKSQAFLQRALMIAVFSIFLIIVAQFNSFATPFIIMTSVLLSTIGVFLGLVIFNMDFIVIMTGIGIISLAGVVVNNAIVLIDYTNLVRKRKRRELGISDDEFLPYEDLLDSIRIAGKTRLRPVLLTAITTVLGLIPMALGMNINYTKLMTEFDPNFYMGGDNADFWGPMAWTVIFGLIFATFLTLVIVPVMYLLADKLTMRLKGKKFAKA